MKDRVTKSLCDAAVEGNVACLHQLLDNDPLILRRPQQLAIPVSSSSTTTLYSTSRAALPLSLACRFGHLEFAQVLLQKQPDLSETVDPYDNSSTPLHIASRNGHLDLVRCLISVNPAACFVRDNQGRNPVHVAAAKGHCDVLDELATVCPQAAREKVVVVVGLGLGHCGDTTMHVCVKHNNLEALKLVVEKVGNDRSILNAGDAKGDTILHVAVANKQVETVHFLVNDPRTNKNALNMDGLTPMDLLYSNDQHHDDELQFLLKEVGAVRSVDLSDNLKSNKTEYYYSSNSCWVENKRNTLMVVASVIATMAFQPAVNPPGGVWQDNSPPAADQHGLQPSASPTGHKAGWSVMAGTDRSDYNIFFIFNTIGLVFSMTAILLLISGLPFKKFTVVVVMVMMWIAVGFMTAAYSYSMGLLLPDDDYFGRLDKLRYTTCVWFGVMGFLIIGHVTRVMFRLLKKLAPWIVERNRLRAVRLGCFRL